MQQKEIYKFIKIYLTLLKEGYSIKDKLAIASYFLSSPLHLLYQKIGKEYKHEFSHPIKIKNNVGIFSCGKSVSTAQIVSSLHEKDIEKYFSINEGVFIDIGAHIGKFTIKLAKALNKKGKVISIEPDAFNFALLKENIRLNKLKNIIPKKIACSDSDGIKSFYLGEHGSGGHSLKSTRGSTEVSVKTSKLDSIISELNLNRADLIKIDVEGAESEVLKGAEKTLRKFRPKIIFEAWSKEDLEKSEKILKALNYSIKQLNSENYLAYYGIK